MSEFCDTQPTPPPPRVHRKKLWETKNRSAPFMPSTFESKIKLVIDLVLIYSLLSSTSSPRCLVWSSGVVGAAAIDSWVTNSLPHTQDYVWTCWTYGVWLVACQNSRHTLSNTEESKLFPLSSSDPSTIYLPTRTNKRDYVLVRYWFLEKNTIYLGLYRGTAN